jgi:hypothetical protein
MLMLLSFLDRSPAIQSSSAMQRLPCHRKCSIHVSRAYVVPGGIPQFSMLPHKMRHLMSVKHM